MPTLALPKTYFNLFKLRYDTSFVPLFVVLFLENDIKHKKFLKKCDY